MAIGSAVDRCLKVKAFFLDFQEKEELIEEWTPEPLVPDVDENHPVLQNMEKRLVSRWGSHPV